LIDKHENSVRARDRENEKAIEEIEERLLRGAGRGGGTKEED
jgi:hypothetical protein